MSDSFISARELALAAGTTPNMIHTYIRTGRIKTTTLEVVTKDKVTGEEVKAEKKVISKLEGLAWAAEHVRRRTERQERQQALIDSQLGRR